MPLARITLAAAVAALLMGGAAVAQPATQDGASPDNGANPPATDQSAPIPADQSGTTTNDQASQPMPPADSSAMAPTGANVSATAPAGVQVIASAPVPDTPANRAKYGKPMSNAGKRTAPTGD